MRSGRYSRDDGFTLTELIVVVTLMTFVLAAAYAAYNLVVQGSNLSNREAWTSREIGAPLDYAERVYIQQFDMHRVEPYLCECYTDRDSDGYRETYIFEATTDGRLVVTSSEEAQSPTPRVWTWSTHNRNRATGTPLFTYLDDEGYDISNQSAAFIQTYARSMVITVVAEYDGAPFSDSRRVFLRNR